VSGAHIWCPCTDLLVLQPMVPEEVVHGMVGVMEGKPELLLPFLDGAVVY